MKNSGVRRGDEHGSTPAPTPGRAREAHTLPAERPAVGGSGSPTRRTPLPANHPAAPATSTAEPLTPLRRPGTRRESRVAQEYQPGPKSETFGEVAIRWLKAKAPDAPDRVDKPVRASTFNRDYEIRLRRHAIPYLGELSLDQVKGPVLKDWLRGLARASI
jgi:hypothetical protein